MGKAAPAGLARWKKKFKGTTSPDQQRLKQLERDQDRLLKLVGKLQLENDAMKDLIRKILAGLKFAFRPANIYKRMV